MMKKDVEIMMELQTRDKTKYQEDMQVVVEKIEEEV